MKSKKILMTSLVPFWRRQTGAQQRMFSLVRALQSTGHEVKTFFPMTGSEHDDDLIRECSLSVERHTSDHPPEGVLQKVGWYARAVVNYLRTVIGARQDPIRRSPPRTDGLKLIDYQWPWARLAFERTVSRYRPDVIICQYVTTAWLLDGLSQSQRSKICCIIDTHDLLFQRKEQFQHRGHSHWIDISKEEEASVLANFDVVVAIQFAEAETMRAMAPDANVIVVGHDAGECHVVERKNNADVDGGEAKFSLGYIGSVNASNVDAIESFLEQTWPRIAENESIELVIAGAICHKIADRVDQLNQQCAGQVRMLGRVENVVDFYQAVDVAINPVQFGTGLKVKTVEAVSHGIPVLTLEPVWAKSGKPSPAVVYLEDLVQLADQIESLLDDGGQAFERLKDRAVQTAKENNARSEKAVYQKLLDQIALSGANNLK